MNRFLSLVQKGFHIGGRRAVGRETAKWAVWNRQNITEVVKRYLCCWYNGNPVMYAHTFLNNSYIVACNSIFEIDINTVITVARLKVGWIY